MNPLHPLPKDVWNQLQAAFIRGWALSPEQRIPDFDRSYSEIELATADNLSGGDRTQLHRAGLSIRSLIAFEVEDDDRLRECYEKSLVVGLDDPYQFFAQSSLFLKLLVQRGLTSGALKLATAIQPAVLLAQTELNLLLPIIKQICDER